MERVIFEPMIRMMLFLLIFVVETCAIAQPRYPQSEQWYNFTDDGHQQYVYELGSAARAGDTVIVLHGGWGAEHSYLLDPLAPLGDRYRFVFYDQRGSLRSPAPDSTIRLDRLVADLEDLRQALKLEQVTLAAHSMGNALAYAYLDRFPERVHGLVLIGPVLPAELTDGPNMGFIQKVWPEADSTALLMDMMSFFEDVGIRTVQRMKVEGMVPDSLMHVPPQELELLSMLEDREWTQAWRIGFTTANTCDNHRWREMQGGMVFYSQKAANMIINDSLYLQRTERFWPSLKAFEGPVRVIIGTCDYVDLGPAVWPHVVNHLRDGKLQVVRESGHSIWMDKPEEFQRAVVTALREMGGDR